MRDGFSSFQIKLPAMKGACNHSYGDLSPSKRALLVRTLAVHGQDLAIHVEKSEPDCTRGNLKNLARRKLL